MPFVIGEVEVTNEVSLAPSAVLYDGAVKADGDLTVQVNNFFYDLGGVKGKYPGSVGNAVTDNTVSYVYLDDTATLVVNTTGYPGTTHIRLARVVASGGFITRVILERAFFTAAIGTSGFVPSSRTISSGGGLTGGGNLSADRTLAVGANADGSITVNTDDIQVGVLATDAQHGSRGGGTQHSTAVAGSPGTAGFISGASQLKLDNLPSTPASGMALWGNSTIGISTTTRFLTPGFTDSIAPTSSIQFRVPKAGTIRNLYVRHNTVGVGAVNLTYTVRKNGSNQTLTVTLLATANDANDTTHSFTVAAGDLIDITVTKASALTASPADITATVEYGP